jgi:cytochrome P450
MTGRCPVRRALRDLSSPAGRADPHPIFARLREAGPLHEVPRFGAALTRYDDVRDVLFDRALLVASEAAAPGSARGEISRRLPPDIASLPAPLFFQDGQSHKRLRKLVAPAFSQGAVNALRPRILSHARGLIDALRHRSEFDLVTELATPLPLLVIADVLGLAAHTLSDMRAWSEAVLYELHPFASAARREAAITAHRAMAAFFRHELAQRTDPSSDLVSTLARAIENNSVNEDEAVSLCIDLVVAGHLTTADLIGNTIALLLAHPEQLARLRREPHLWPNAVDEALRLEPPMPLLARVAPCPGARHGRTFARGDNINVFIASANRDPRVYANPDRFDVAREGRPHLSFGGGAHFCLGASLARAECEIAARILFERMPALACDRAADEWRDHPNFRGMRQLMVHRKTSRGPRTPAAIQL